MKVTAEPIEHSQVVLNIEVDADRLDRAERQAAVRLANAVAIPGFRKGKAPRHIIERMVGPEAIRDEALDKLLPAVYVDAVKEAGIDPIEQPQLEITAQEPLTIKAVVPVRPTFELGDYSAVRIEPETVDVTDEQVEETVGQFREQHAQYVPVERGAQAGDRVRLDVKGASGETKLIERENFEFDLDLDSQFPAPGFGAQIVGLTAGETRTVTLTYPEDYRIETLKGREAEFVVTVHEVKERRLPEFDGELAKLSGFGDSIDGMREEIRRRLTERETTRVTQDYERQVVDAVVDLAPIDLPPQLVERAIDDMIRRTEDRLRQQQMSLDLYLQYSKKTREEMREESRPNAERSLRAEFVLNEIARREGIEVSNEEVDQTILGMAQVLTGGGDERQMRQTIRELNNPRTRTGLAHDIMETKVRTRLVQIARGEGTGADADAAPAASDAGGPGATSSTSPVATETPSAGGSV